MPIQILLVVALLIALTMTWKRAKEGVIRAREAVLWSIVWIAAGVVIVLPETTSAVANLLGVGRGVDLVLYASVVVLFFLVFKLFTSLDRMDKQITDLVRKDALRDLDHQDETPTTNNQ
ncbi:DUF2304 family protein [Candidatus Uhrbacteria bacterium]|nr:DUF2304 family protein [Candidatus Uhrbacteria bacterium]MBD3284214.1 DUF2304 family protein [Candidatus Uhrbacteria bacterium]